MNRYIALEKIVELGSFTKAAEALGYTQSAISQMISSVEDELSMKLLYRSRVGVKLTLEGKALFPFIQNTILKYEAMQEKAKEIRGLDTGVIRIGTISSISCHWMPMLIKGFQALYPNVQFILHQGDHSSIQQWIKVGAVDFGFITPAAITGLQTITIKDGAWLAVLPENHKLASHGSINLEELVNESFILLEEGNFSEPLEAFRSCNLEPNIKFCIHDDYTIMTMVEAGLGISILPELVLRRTNYGVALCPVNPPIVRTIAIGFKDKSSLPMASKYFIEYLISNIEKLP